MIRFKNISITLLFVFITSLLGACNNNNNKMFQGYVEGVFTYVSSPESGKLLQREVNKGEQVKTNDLLFVLDPQPEQDQLSQAEHKLAQATETLNDIRKGERQTNLDAITAQIAQVKAQLNYDKKTLERYTKLLKTGAIDKASVDEISAAHKTDIKKVQQLTANLAEAKLGARKNQIKAQEALVRAAQAETNKARWALSQKTKYAPTSGLIYNTYYSIGEFVDAGQPVLSLLPPGEVKLIFFIPENILGSIKIGEKINFHCDGCKENYSAKITYISQEAEYTPPVIYSRSSREKLVYRVEAQPSIDVASKIHVGQPVDVFLTN